MLPGLIHSYHPDGGAKTIADFTNYEKCQLEILWYFRHLGIHDKSVHYFQVRILILIPLRIWADCEWCVNAWITLSPRHLKQKHNKQNTKRYFLRYLQNTHEVPSFTTFSNHSVFYVRVTSYG